MTLERFATPGAAAAWCRAQRDAGRTLGFVPTMGALHEGHLALVSRSLAENERTCVSVFVNPLQFDEASDFERYPRDFEGDARLLAGIGCDAVFTGELAEFFPEALGAAGARGDRDEAAARIDEVDPGPASIGLEGAHRPGHFAGVATIVDRLFELVRPRRAYFGEKDFQQTLVVAHVARRFEDLEVVVCPTERAPDGLALSSRNERLAPAERERALALSRALFAARDAWRAGERDAQALARTLAQTLDGPGLEPEYAAVRDPDAWSAEDPRGPLARARGLVAARVGSVRLIDTLELGAS